MVIVFAEDGDMTTLADEFPKKTAEVLIEVLTVLLPISNEVAVTTALTTELPVAKAVELTVELPTVKEDVLTTVLPVQVKPVVLIVATLEPAAMKLNPLAPESY
jgi:hypothetical protein